MKQLIPGKLYKTKKSFGTYERIQIPNQTIIMILSTETKEPPEYFHVCFLYNDKILTSGFWHLSDTMNYIDNDLLGTYKL